ncbi:MAG: 5-formyltetrahydrofolate cyclo-ligase [Flavobacteriales bacterium]|nr:5-formyltetrahydrofolate cyclo-ligase [Flavobacteriales bacterium]
MLKVDLRNTYRSKRKELSEKLIQEFSKKIADQLFSAYKHVNVTHLFLSIKKFNEVDTSWIIKELQQNDLITCTGVTDFENGTMLTVAFTDEIEIKTTAFGVPEPIGGPTIDNLDIDRVIIPLLAFDQTGNRVGYGKGFYDRFLATCRPDVEKIGISFYEAETIIDDASLSDVKLDACITPNHIYRFS